MKLFNSIKKWFGNQENLFYLFLFVLIVPNVVLCFTEPLPLVAKIANVLLPLGCYYLIMTLSRNCGKMLWILFLFVFFGAFQIVLLYLFGQSIIAVDMFLNLATTNSSEAMELLDNLLPALITIVILYIPALILGMISIVRKRTLSVGFIRRERRRASTDVNRKDAFILYFTYDTSVTYSNGSYTILSGAYIISNANYSGEVNLYSDKAKTFFTDTENQGYIKGAKYSDEIGWTDSNFKIKSNNTSSTCADSVNFRAKDGKLNGKYTSDGTLAFRWESQNFDFFVRGV